MKRFTRPLQWAVGACAVTALATWGTVQYTPLEASSHREAPLIADDPLADNTDVYAFKDPNDPEKIIIIADYIPFQLAQGGPNYYTFGENVRYEIHVKNQPGTTGDDIVYRFTFTRTNGDPSTFFNVRLGAQNLKTTYTCEKIVAGGTPVTIVSNGVVPAYNIGPRSISGSPVGLAQASYTAYRQGAVTPASGGGGEQVFCGSSDDPFYVDLGAIFDLAGLRANRGARDGLAKYNVHSIALSIPVATLQKSGQTAAAAANILDGNYVIGVWASASRPAMRTLNGGTTGTTTATGAYTQVSRLGMPLFNEAINPIGAKDAWNRVTPYNEAAITDDYLSNPELSLYMADDAPVNGAAPKPANQTYYGEAVPALNPLRIQTKSLGAFDFRNGAAGLSGLTAAQRAGTVFADPIFGPYLLVPGKPRSVDIKPIFHTGVPNLIPYQLATGKNGNPLAAGKPFINNFLPVLGDMLRLNMAVPATPRNSPDFSNQGLLAAAVLGLTDSRYNGSTTLQNIPNMDGFPNGRRLEDEVVKIELQAVSGAVLAAIGLWYDDYTPGTTASPVTPQLKNVLNFTAGVEKNDTTFRTTFPYVQTPWQGMRVRR
jgi:hypothetical protein